jgi:hypothetical protein
MNILLQLIGGNMKNIFILMLITVSFYSHSQFIAREVGVIGDANIKQLGKPAVGLVLINTLGYSPIYTKFEIMGKIGEKILVNEGTDEEGTIPTPFLTGSAGIEMLQESVVGLRVGYKGIADFKQPESRFSHGPEVVAGVRFSDRLKLNVGGFYDMKDKGIRLNSGLSFRVNKQ